MKTKSAVELDSQEMALINTMLHLGALEAIQMGNHFRARECENLIRKFDRTRRRLHNKQNQHLCETYNVSRNLRLIKTKEEMEDVKTDQHFTIEAN